MTQQRKLMKYRIEETKTNLDNRQERNINLTLDITECADVMTTHGKEVLKRMLMERFESVINGMLY